MNGVRYHTVLTDFLFPSLDQMNIENVWFQQDSATCHTARETIALLHEKFSPRPVKYVSISYVLRSRG